MTMDCKQIDELLVDYLYQELEPAQVVPFEAHLESCVRCAGDVRSYERTREAVGTLQVLDPPPAVNQLLLDEARRRAPVSPSLLDRVRRALQLIVIHPAAAAALTLMVVLGVSFYVYEAGMDRSADMHSDSPLPLAAPGAEEGALAEPSAGAAPAGGAERAQKFAAADEANRPLGQPQDKLNALAAQAEQRDEASAGKLTRGRGPRAASGVADQRRPKPRALRKRARASSGYESKPAPSYKSMDPPVQAVAQEQAPSPPRADRPRQEQPAQQTAIGGASRESVSRRVVARARRSANTGDVGGGGAGIWGNKYRSARRPSRSSSYSAPSASPYASPYGAQGRAKGGLQSEVDDKDQSPSGAPPKAVKAVAPAPKKVDVVEALLAAAERDARAGRCSSAVRYYAQALQQRPAVLPRITARIGPCLSAARRNKRYGGLASRVDGERRRQAARRKAASESKKANKAAPAAAH